MKSPLAVLNHYRWYRRLSALARQEEQADRRGLPLADPGNERTMAACLEWLALAQDHSLTGDGGVARHYSLNSGWGPSYPETTGYLVPTILAMAARTGEGQLFDRARRMLDFLSAIQMPSGAFQGGVIGALPVKPTTFNTGQILIGLAAGAQHFGGAYVEAMHKAARWLVQTQDADGAWRSYPSPFTSPGVKVYETHVAWGLLEAARLAPAEPYGAAGLANVRWALQFQQPNGWFSHCCLSHPEQPLTHTLGYVLRGVLEAFRFSGEERFLQAARLTADALLDAVRPDGALPGRLGADWRGQSHWTCLTGNVQIAACWLMLYRISGNERYLLAAKAANRFVRRTIRLEAPDGIRGGVKGSFPVGAEYLSYEYPNWAVKFFLDSCLLEEEISLSPAGSGCQPAELPEVPVESVVVETPRTLTASRQPFRNTM